MENHLDLEYLEVKQDDKTFILTKIPAGILTQISYAAVRNKDKEEGAVQRTLVESRIAGVKEFAKSVGDFPASVVLNWNSDPIEKLPNGKIRIAIRSNITQIIDG